MSVFRAAAGEPVHRPAGPSYPPAPPGQRVPQQRVPDLGFPEGPTEPLGVAGPYRAPHGEAPARAHGEAPARTHGEAPARAHGEAPVRVPGEAPVRPPHPAAPARANTVRANAVRERSARERAARGNAARGNTTPGAASAPPPPAAPRARRRPGVAVAVLFSLLALLASGAAGWFSWRVLEAVRSGAVPRPTPPTEATVPARSRPPEPQQYPVAFAKEPLRLQVACAAVVHLDLDEPRADAAEVLADLRYDGACGTRPPQLSLGVGAAGASRRGSADTDAADCDRAIRTSPLGRGQQVAAETGTALCVLTAAVPAALVLVEIIDVGGSGTAGLRATAWRVPQDR